MRFKKSEFNQKELDFYYFCKQNFTEIINLPLKDIAQKFGCGISFIYNFFKTNHINGNKQFIKLLAEDIYEDHLELSHFGSELEGFEKNLAQITVATINEIKTEYTKAINQKDKITAICELFTSAKHIYGLGFGYSRLAIADLFGFLNYFDTPLTDLNYDLHPDLQDIVQPNSVVIFYSVRFAQKKYLKIIKTLKKINNCHVILITSARVENSDIDIIYQIENAVKFQESFGKKYLLSPLTSFCLFNTFIKTHIYEYAKSSLLKNSAFIKESFSWYEK